MKNKKIRQYRSNQGRSPKRETESMKVIIYASAILVVLSVIALIVELVW
tara:strand:- start:3126 stop:3272 length:147 start_codon:yes stop_codon:yes gene_type:complete